MFASTPSFRPALPLTALLALAFAAPPAIAQDQGDNAPERRRIVGTFDLSARALVVFPKPEADDTDADADRGNVVVTGRGKAIARPRTVTLRLGTLTSENERVEVELRIDNPLDRSKRLHGKLFRGDAVARITAGDRTAHVKVVIAGSIAPDGDGGAVLNARIHTVRRDAPVNLRGAIKGVLVEPAHEQDGGETEGAEG